MLRYFRYLLLQNQETKKVELVFVGFSYFLVIFAFLNPLHLLFFIYKKDFKNFIIFICFQSLIILIFTNMLSPEMALQKNIVFYFNLIIPSIALLFAIKYNSNLLNKYLNNNYKIIGFNKVDLSKYQEHLSIVEYTQEEQKQFITQYTISALIRTTIAFLVLLVIIVMFAKGNMGI